VLFLLLASLAGCSNEAISSPSAERVPPIRAEHTSGSYRLVFELSKAEWRAGEAIDGVASLEVTGGDAVTISGAGSLTSSPGIFGFEFSQVRDSLHVTPTWPASCQTYRLEPDAPITSAIQKSGSIEENDPDRDFYRSFLTAPDVRLPQGECQSQSSPLSMDIPSARGHDNRFAPRFASRLSSDARGL
jgi:hypothetical protein